MSTPESGTSLPPRRRNMPDPRIGQYVPPNPPQPALLTRSARITLAVLGPLALYLAWRVLTLGLADLWVESNPERALFWRPSHPQALLDAADDDVSHLKFPEAKALALRTLAAYPLEGRAYRELGDVADFFGDQRDAKRLLTLALHRAPRDVSTRTKLIEYDLKTGNLQQALHQIDIVLRIQPEIIPDLVPRLVGLSQDSVVVEPLSRILIARPPWRQIYLATLATTSPDPEAVDRVFAQRGGNDLMRGGGTEADLLVQRQIKDGRWAQAYAAWANTLSKTEQTVLGNVYDGGFTFPPSNKGFAWQIPNRGTGYDVLVAPRTRFTTDNVMQIRFNGLPLNYQPIKQLLVLGSGHYRLTGMGQAGAMTSDDGLQWVVACAEGQSQVLAKSQPFTGDMAWNSFDVEFDVPDTDCEAQWLRLDLGTGIFRGQPLEGAAIFDNLEITRVGATAPIAANDQVPGTAPASDKANVDQATIDGLQ